MQNNSSFLNLFSNSAAMPTDLRAFTLNLLLAAVLAFILGQAYVRFGHALANRKLFARNFVLLTLTTTLIISIVKSSLALSLGLVGALSIVRFRAAIKEPEELAYLFLAISVGLGLGAGQIWVTLLAFGIILGIVAIGHLFRGGTSQPNLYLTVISPEPRKLGASQIMEVLGQLGATATLKRFDETPDLLEAAFLVNFKDTGRLEEFNRRIREKSEGVRVSYVEERGPVL